MLDKLFLQILSMSFTASFVITFVLLARLLLKKAPKIFSYALWLVVLFRLIFPFSFESVFSLLPSNTTPISQDIVYMQTPQIDTGIASINNAVNTILPAAAPHVSANPLQIWLFIGSFIWLLGIAALLFYSLITLFRLQKRLQDATLYQDRIFTSDKINTAFVMGVFRPKIYLPAYLKDEERHYILLHEQTHLRRFDHIIKLLSFLVLCVHWFNPFVWIAFFFSGKDMEMSCDEAVIKQLGKDVKKDYSSSLLSLATGMRIIGGTPLAFGEGDTKGRIKNVLYYKKPAFWVVLASIVAVIFVLIGLSTNPKTTSDTDGFTGVNAIILSIDNLNQTMTVKGIDENSVIGDHCILSLDNETNFITVINREPNEISLNDYSIGDNVVLSLDDEIAESNPTRATATTIQLQPKEMLDSAYSVEDLWNARTKYVGNHVAVGKLIGLLPVWTELKYHHFELKTETKPYKIEIVYSVSTEILEKYDTENATVADLFRRNALLLLALIDNVDEIQATLTDGNRKLGFINGREWADYTVASDVRDYAQSPEKLQKLIDFISAETNDETVAAEYYIMKVSKNSEVLSEYSSESQALAEAIIMDSLVKSAAWEGVDINTLEEYYHIRQTFPETKEVDDYYAYRLKDGTAVLQSGAFGRYTTLSDDLYEDLAKYAISPAIDGDAQAVKNAKYSQSLIAEELKQTEEVVRNHFTTEAPYYEGIVSIELMPDDSYLYKNTGIESEYEAGNIIIYKVLTGRDKKDHYPERSVSVARDSKNAAWKVINHGY